MTTKTEKSPQLLQIGTADLIPYARNAKKHDAAQVAKIAGCIREFGFNNPVLIDSENGIIAGHGRVMAAQKLGLESVPCLRLDHLSETQKQAYILADNRLAEVGGGWDMEMLKVELAALAEADFDLDSIGFGEDFDFEDALSGDYTNKVKAPVYEPKGEKPPIEDLVNTEKADELKAKIQESNAPDEIKRFLGQAAQRHVVFDYGKIAEFYCHAEKEIQELMEDSALVIIDFKKALQHGYVKLNEGVLEALEAENN
jgi:hypothetical protein